MNNDNAGSSDAKPLEDFFIRKSEATLALFDHFVNHYRKIGEVSLITTKTMIGIATPIKRIAWVTQLGKSFVHVVFPFSKPYYENLCFQKIAEVPGDKKQFNHHFRMYLKEDLNDEVLEFMKKAYQGEM